MKLDADTEWRLRELLDGYFPTGLRDFDELIAAISDIIAAAVKKERKACACKARNTDIRHMSSGSAKETIAAAIEARNEVTDDT